MINKHDEKPDLQFQSVKNETFLCKGLDLVSRSVWMRDRRNTAIMIVLNILCSDWVGL